LAIASFFVKKQYGFPSFLKGYFISATIYMTAITQIGLAAPDLAATIKWHEQVLGFKLLAGPY
jgi:hypothetical protein